MNSPFVSSHRFGGIHLSRLVLPLLLFGLLAARAGAALPATPTATVSSAVTFAAPASNPAAFSFQWKFDGADLINGTESTLTIFSAAVDSSGTYSVTTTSSAGAVTTTVAELTVRVGELTNQAVTVGHGLSFSAGSTSGSLQWQVSTPGGPPPWTNLADGGIYSGVTSSHLTISNTTLEMNHLRYRFVSADHGVVIVSRPASLTVSAAVLPFPTSITVTGNGNLLVGDASANTIQRIDSAGLVFPVAGTSGTAGTTDGVGGAARFNQPNGLAALANGAIVVADTANATIRLIAADGTVTTLAGRSGVRGHIDGAGAGATFASPTGIARDATGILYVADSMNHIIRRITPDGVVSTFAGRPGVPGFADADGTGPAAIFNFPTGLAVDRGGNVYVADTNNSVIRKITPAGVVSTLAGLPNFAGYDDGAGADALFSHPGGLAVDAAGNILVADTDNSTIRRISPTGMVTTLAGIPTITGLSDGVGLAALFNHPQALTFDERTGDIFVADTGNAAIRSVNATRNAITLVLTAAEVPPQPSLPPSPPPAPAPTPPPSAPPPPAPASYGGGGAPSVEFLALLSVLFLCRRRQARGSEH